MEKKLILLIVAVFIICIIFSFFAGTLVGVAPLGIAGIEYSMCPRWKCTFFKSSSTNQIMAVNYSFNFNGYNFLLLDVRTSQMTGYSTAKIQISKENVLDTFWIRLNETHYTLGGTYGLAISAPNRTAGVSYKGYTVYVKDGENDKWAYIQVKDSAGRVVWSEIIEEGRISTFPIGNTTILKVKLIDVKASMVTGEVYAQLIVGDTDIYTTILDASNKNWAQIKIYMYYPYTSYVCSFNNPGNCEVYGSCRYCPILE
ncbi:MAG: hypothetical protein QXQ69_01635 [Candidatus Aenigmatarchaeota archaeon]